MSKYNVYTDAERKAHLARYWEIKDQDPSYSIRKYSNDFSLSYYVFRDWYRTKKYNDRYGLPTTPNNSKKAKTRKQPAKQTPKNPSKQSTEQYLFVQVVREA